MERQLSTQEIKLRDFAKVIQIGGMHAILQMVEEDAGISFMYESAAKKAIVSGVIREIKLKDFKVVHDFAFVWDKRALFGSDYREICSQIVGH